LAWLGVLAVGCVLPWGRHARPVMLAGDSAGLVGFRSVRPWKALPAVDAGTRVFLSPPLGTTAPWNELVVSWNVEPAESAGLTIEALPVPVGAAEAAAWDPVRETGYRMGDWSPGEGGQPPRTSRRGQKDEVATVKTDILVLREPAREARLRLTLHGNLARHPERVRLVTASFCDTTRRPEPRPARTEVWGRRLAVPERSQIAYPGGEGWCSPTSVSMVLAWWSGALKRPELDRDVPEVVRGVFDPGWGGTGNWPFNTAYAGSFPGLRACAARLRDLRDVEDQIAAGMPVVMSVHPPALRGRGVAPDAGHLIVCTGFTESGDVHANDPWARLEEGQTVSRVYARAAVERAWEHAHRLAYLVAPTRKLGAWPATWR
jgi:hypothetical protein